MNTVNFNSNAQLELLYFCNSDSSFMHLHISTCRYEWAAFVPQLSLRSVILMAEFTVVAFGTLTGIEMLLLRQLWEHKKSAQQWSFLWEKAASWFFVLFKKVQSTSDLFSRGGVSVLPTKLAWIQIQSQWLQHCLKGFKLFRVPARCELSEI